MFSPARFNSIGHKKQLNDNQWFAKDLGGRVYYPPLSAKTRKSTNIGFARFVLIVSCLRLMVVGKVLTFTLLRGGYS